MDEQNENTPLVTRSKSVRIVTLLFLIGSVMLACQLFMLIQAPFFVKEKTLTIEPGMSVLEISRHAKDEHIVRSGIILYSLLTYMYDPKSIYAGSYVFLEETNVFGVAKKLAGGDIEVQKSTLTIPEGMSRKDIARLADALLAQFDEVHFLEISKGKEGYLFPDTYYVPPQYTPEELLELLLKTGEEKRANTDFSQSKLTLDEVLILASILEREANDADSMKLVSGILQNRLRRGMPLQADATIEYILEKPLKELTPEDLKIDSPYNTYLYKGLPPTAIGNPGMLAIEAVLSPANSDYLFYITDNDGTFHYAKTYSVHQNNIERFLR